MKSRRASTSPEGLPLLSREGLRPAGPRPAPATGMSAATVEAAGGPGVAGAAGPASIGGAESTAGPVPAAASCAGRGTCSAEAATGGALPTGATCCGKGLAGGTPVPERPAISAASWAALASASLALAASASALAASWAGPGATHCGRTAAAAWATMRSSSTEPKDPQAAELAGRWRCSESTWGPAWASGRSAPASAAGM